MSKYIIDIETNGLLEQMLDYSSFPYKLNSDARLWCVVLNNITTGEIISATKEQITKDWLRQNLKDCTYLIGHNIIEFDLMALKLFGVLDYSVGYLGQSDTLFGKEIQIKDTLILSRLLNPDRYLGHSLGAWGNRLGVQKIDFRQSLIDAELLEPNAKSGTEFLQYSNLMLDYCIGDTITNAALFDQLIIEANSYTGWCQAGKLEGKLADLSLRRENLGFSFNKEMALDCLDDLGIKMRDLKAVVNPILPEKPLNKGEMSRWIPPKTQILKGDKVSSNLMKFADKVGGEIYKKDEQFILKYKDKEHILPYHESLETHMKADINDLDHVKMHLINLGWNPTEWRVRDLTKTSTKQNLPYEKRIECLNRWYKETMEGKYKESRLKALGIKESDILYELSRKLKEDYPVMVPTSPSVRVGVEKELCPNLTKLGDKVSFAKDFSLYLTYKHRKASIAGGDIEDMDFAIDQPNTGYLSMYREVDGRVRTPAILIGAATNRYRHIGIANIPRATSIYGKEMRSLFGCGKDAFQLGFDYSSLENRIQGNYVTPYENGQELAKALIAEKPNDIHSQNALKMNISRTDAKSVGYALLYGAQPAKISKMLSVSNSEGKRLFNEFWNAVLPLKCLKEDLIREWEKNDCKFIKGIDGRKINIRSKHSILNFLFQSGGVIAVKYASVFLMQILEDQGYCIDPFIAKPDVCSMVEYHDEQQLYVNKELIKFKTFETEEEAREFVANWQDDDQLSTISEGKKWYVSLPSVVSKAITEAIRKTEQILNLNVSLGFEFKVASNWMGCH